jgi:nucleotide-binding universal stress UspA family protein
MAMKIVVGVDGSEPSLNALRWATHEARRRGAELLLVSCYTVPALGGIDGAVYPSSIDVEVLKAESAAVIEQAKEIVAAIDPQLVVSGAAPMASPVVGITEAAEPGDEIVVGATGHSGMLYGLIGSVTTGVTHRAHVPVIVVPFKSPTGVGDAIKRIVVGVDGSPESMGALEWAYDEAIVSGAELTVVHAWIYPYTVSHNSMREIRKPLELEAARELQSSLDSLGKKLTDGAVVLHSTLSENTPAEALVQEAIGADLIVVGSRGRGGLRSVLLGSVSHMVVYNAQCPVAVIRVAEAPHVHHREGSRHESSTRQLAVRVDVG